LPELQGRLPIRVELSALSRDDLKRILTEPEASLIKQYKALLKTEDVTLEFADDSIDALADLAAEINSSVENIGARRLHTVMERLLEDISFTATDRSGRDDPDRRGLCEQASPSPAMPTCRNLSCGSRRPAAGRGIARIPANPGLSAPVWSSVSCRRRRRPRAIATTPIPGRPACPFILMAPVLLLALLSPSAPLGARGINDIRTQTRMSSSTGWSCRESASSARVSFDVPQTVSAAP
jgi:hypothetical protein